MDRTDSTQSEAGYGGQFNSSGGSQFIGNSFSTGGAPIHFNSSSDNSLPASVCELPDFLLSSYFTGRSDELQQIDRAFGAFSDGLPARCVIHGMPGVGKTQLALRYARLVAERSQDMYIFWVSAGSVEKLARDFSKVADLLRLSRHHALDQVTKLTLARAWLEDSTTKKKWLLILDNVTRETITMIQADIIPRRNSDGRLLFTTQTATIADLCTIPDQSLTIALQPPGIDDAVAMLAAGAGIGGESTDKASNADLERLVRSVGNLPLAIDQAASYSKGYASSTKELLDLYESEEIIEVLSWENDLSHYEKKSVVATFMPALNKILQTAPDALTLLRLLCFCDPENIPLSILVQGCCDLYQECRCDVPVASAVNDLEAIIGLFRSPLRIAKAIREIQRLSLAVYTLEGSERIIRIHDLVQLLLRSELIAASEREQWLEMVICIVCKAFDKIDDYRSPRNWGRCDQFISHIEFMEGCAAQYGLRNATLLEASAGAATYVNACGLYEKAANMRRRTLDQRKALLGEEHPDTLSSMGNLASTYWNQGRWKEAEELDIRVIETEKTVLGEKHSDTLVSMANLASTYFKQGRWKKAEKLGMEVIKTQKRMLGEKHPDTLNSMANLASVYFSQGRSKDAEALKMKVMEERKRMLGEEHGETLRSMADLAAIYQGQERWKEAEKLEMKVIKIRKRVLGEEHPQTLIIMGNLASTYKNQERWEEAERLDIRVLETRQRLWGEKHPDTLIGMSSLASTYYGQGRWKNAEELNMRILETSQRVLGKEHPHALVSMNNLAFTWKAQGRNAEAVNLMEQCVHLRSQILGADHPSTVSSSATLTDWQRGYLEIRLALRTS